MNRISTPLRIGIGMASLTMSVMFAAQMLGLIPNLPKAILDGRKGLCENLAVECSLAAQRDDTPMMTAVMQALRKRNDTVLSAAVRRADGKLLAEVGDHQSQWLADAGNVELGTHVEVPIFRGKQRWGTVEIRFAPVETAGLGGWLISPLMRLIVFVTAAAFLVHFWYLKRVLQHLDPSSVIPDRVRATLDTLVEGVLVLNQDQRIVLANQAFLRSSGRSADQLQGMRADSIQWSQPQDNGGRVDFPWHRAIHEGVSQTGVMLEFKEKSDQHRTFAVNTMPILGGDGRRRGALVTFDDVTSIEKKNHELEGLLRVLQDSRDEIHRQNEELTVLATRDPLTSCLNRRAFFTQFETLWEAASTSARPLSCIMIDLDHFKAINDNYGHSAGDVVLQRMGAMLRRTVRSADVVCRFGGEEFCVLLPDTALDSAHRMADALRASVAAIDGLNAPITASLGVSTIGHGASDLHELLDQADKSLYVSKRNGRNRVTICTEVSPDLQLPPASRSDSSAVRENTGDVAIPFHAVAALTAALAYRDSLTAEHSRRVADLCVLIARGLVSERECYVLEVAALLHDIGKLGVPDCILFKPGPLTEEEWRIMGTHDQIGVEIIKAAFSSKELSEMIRCHHLRFDGHSRHEATPNVKVPCGNQIPLRARILTIADAYDAIISDRVYRRGKCRDEAFVELRRCAGKQFDPQLVERLIQVVSADDQGRAELTNTVSKQTALRIGLQIERLAEALDDRDFSGLSAMAGRLACTANADSVPEIANLATELEHAASEDADMITVVRLTTELLEMCRATQSSYLAATPLAPPATAPLDQIPSVT